MKKLLLPLSLAACFILTGGYAQDNLEQLEKEIAQIKSEVGKAQNQITSNTQKLDEQLAHIKKQDEKIASYEKALKLLETKHVAKLDDVVFNITQVTGNKSEGTMTFKGVIVNEGTGTVQLHASSSEYFDNEGHQTKGIANALFGESNTINAIGGIPVKLQVVFKNIPNAKTAKVTALSIRIMKDSKPPRVVVFKNMDIEWED